MNQESKNWFLAIIAIVGFYVLYTQYLNTKYPKPVAELSPVNPNPVSNPVVNPPVVSVASESISTIKRLTDAEMTFETAEFVAKLNQDSGGFQSIKLKKYKKDIKTEIPGDLREAELVDLSEAGYFVLQPHINAAPAQISSVYLKGFEAKREANSITFARQIPGWNLDHKITFPAEGFVGKAEVSFKNTLVTAQNLKAQILIEKASLPEVKKQFQFIPGGPVFKPRFIGTFSNEDEFIETEKFCDAEPKTFSGRETLFDFVGFDNHYFLTTFQPKDKFDFNVMKTTSGPVDNKTCPVQIALNQDRGMVQPGEVVKFEMEYFFGPKDLEVLTSYREVMRVTLGLGWLDLVAKPLLLAIKGLYKVTFNYGIAVILLTLLIKILFYPLAKKSAQSAAKMKVLNPQMTAIRERFKDDPQKLQREMMGFMSKNKINPVQGCLPILPQIPVFFALYRVLSASIELRHAPFFGWIQDLSAADPYLITPLLLGAGMFVQQRLTPTPGMDKTQQRVLLFMPLIFTVMMLTLPSGLVLYMLTNTLTSIAQQYWLNKKLTTA